MAVVQLSVLMEVASPQKRRAVKREVGAKCRTQAALRASRNRERGRAEQEVTGSTG